MSTSTLKLLTAIFLLANGALARNAFLYNQALYKLLLVTAAAMLLLRLFYTTDKN